MDQLEDQVSDLRYLSQNPPIQFEGPTGGTGFSLQGSASNTGQHSSALSATNSALRGSFPTAIASPLPHHNNQSYNQQPPFGPATTGAAAGSSVAGSANSIPGKVTKPTGVTATVSTKRKVLDDDGGSASGGAGGGGDGSAPDTPAKQTRTKRNRYISIACNECKRRKIKCNGEAPCQRCGSLNLACLYSPNCCSGSFKESEEFKQVNSQVNRLQEQVETLFTTINTLRSETLRLAPIQDRSLPPPVAPSTSPSISMQLPGLKSFRGPTSIGFSLDVAKNTLHNLGIGSHQHSDGDRDGSNSHFGPVSTPSESVSSPFHPPPPPSRQAPIPPPNNTDFSDPIWDFDKDEMIQLCQLHEEEVGIMYPVVKMKSIIDHVMALARWMELCRARRALFDDSILIEETTLQVKIIMCCALVVEGHGQSDKATRMYESLQNITNRRLMSDEGDISKIPFLALVAGYRFLANEEVLAWRVMGQVSRLCLELGLHRRDNVFRIENEELRANAINTFWSAYVLDRRWSFGTGLPYVVQDDQVDPNLPLPTQFPYLVAMITYSRVGAKVWKIVPHFQPVIDCELQRADIKAMDQEILSWYASVPNEVQIEHWGEIQPMPSTPSYNLERLQIWTRLRLNQIRIWLYTPILHTNTSIMAHLDLATLAVDLAQDTITYLNNLNNTSNIYRKIQVFYHQFLTSAIAVLFLASVHAPVQFSAKCRREFYLALELVRDLGAKSWVSQRLWQTIKGLKDDGRRLGLVSDDDENGNRYRANENPISMSSVPTAGLASSASSTTPSNSSTVGGQYGNNRGPPLPPISGAAGAVRHGEYENDGMDNGTRLHDEMSKIFEGYTGMNGLPPAPNYNGDGASAGRGGGGPGSNGGENGGSGGGGIYFSGNPASTSGMSTPGTDEIPVTLGGYQVPIESSVYGKFTQMF